MLRVEKAGGKDEKNPLRCTTLTPEDIDALTFLSDMSGSKKNANVRHVEVVKIVQKPLETFFEEKLSYYLLNINSTPVLRALCLAISENGSAKESDFVDELLRQVQKQQTWEG